MFWAAFILGIAGSFHCAGMCGPIALIVPSGAGSKHSRILNVLTYNLGRVLLYSTLGAIFGIVGYGLSLTGFHQLIAIAIGCIMILTVLVPYMFSNKFKIYISDSKLVSVLRKSITNQLKKKNRSGYLMLGILNGLLPCGLVYIALTSSILMDSPLKGAIYMGVFGLGTVPMMLFITVLKDSLSGSIKLLFSRAMPVLTLIVGIFFVLRGMGLEIPYLSPPEETMKVYDQSKEKTPTPNKSCH